MYEQAGHPTNCNYYYAMTEILGLDPERKEDREEFRLLVKSGEIRQTIFGKKVSEYLYDTQSILAYQRRLRRKVEKELKQLTEAIEGMEKRMVELLERLVDEVKKAMREGEGWKEKK